MLTYSIYSVIVWSVMIMAYLGWLYFSAKPKHRKEKVRINWFWKNTYGETSIVVPRALVPFFDKFYLGFCGLATQVKKNEWRNYESEMRSDVRRMMRTLKF